MPVIKCKTHIDVYKERAKASDFELLNGRYDRYTKVTNENIIKHMNFNKNDIVLDIGCGNASLLFNISENIKFSYGILPSNEEVSLVNEKFKNLNNKISIFKSYSDNINLDSDFCDKIICNGVFILLDSISVEKTLKEIYRISKPNAIIFLGEIPFTDESVDQKYGSSIVLWLIDSLFKTGIKKFISNIYIVIKSIINEKNSFIIVPKTYYYLNEKDFISKLKEFNFEIININKHEYTKTRNNYIIKIKGNKECKLKI